jgi:MFS family permease
MFASGLTLFLLGITFGALSGWKDILSISVSVIGPILLVIFVFNERVVRSPMMDLSLFKVRSFSAGVFANLLAAVARGAFSLVLVFYFQGPLGLDAFRAGLLLVPFSLAFVSSGPISGYLSDRRGATGFTVVGLLISAAAFLWFATIPPLVPYYLLVIPMVLTGIGGGMFIAPNVSSIMSSVPVDRRGVASGMSSMFFNTGFVLSIAIAFTLMSANVPLPILQAIFAGNKVSISSIHIGLFVAAMHEIFLLSAVISIIAMLSLLLRRTNHRAPSASPTVSKV